MRKGKHSFRHESLQDADSIAKSLQAITKAIGKGRITLSDDEDRVVMEPEGLLHLKVSASQEDGRERLNIRITWQVDDTPPKKKGPLRVKS